VVLVLWVFTAGAGFSLLASGNLGRARAPEPEPAAVPARSKPAKRQDQWATPSLTAARTAPMVPGVRSLLEFAHPACAIVGLGFWLGFTLVHYRPLGWIALGLISATACAGLTWFTANARASRRGRGPSFPPRLVILHGTAAAVTLTLAALAALSLVT
jgi:hypothetical protein